MKIALLPGDGLHQLTVQEHVEVREVQRGIVGVHRHRHALDLLEEPEVVLVLAPVERRGHLVTGVHLVVVHGDRERRLPDPQVVDDDAVLVDRVFGRRGARA